MLLAVYRIRLAGSASVLRLPLQCFIIGPRHAPAAGRKLVPVGLASPILYLPSFCHHGGGMRLPLIVVLCFPPFGVLNPGVPPKRANAPVAVVRVVVVQRAGGIHVADVVRVRRYKSHPKKNAPALLPRRIPSFCRFPEPFKVFLSPTGRHAFYLNRTLIPFGTLIL